jgi:peptidoglycan/xylan/chitin deacetylase (PgdA/CDA1 family)
LGRAVDRLLGSRVVANAFGSATRHRLRVLAYHDVSDTTAFATQLAWLVRHYEPVTQSQVIASVRDGRALPERSVWVTFDDGHPAVVERGQPVLEQFGIRATLFVCPGLVDCERPHWWQAVEQALAAGVRPRVGEREWASRELVTYLKTVSDADRRRVVQDIQGMLRSLTGRAAAGRQLTTAELATWLGAGHSIGNHTWDHPCLDMCTAEEQIAQITRADEWLRANTDEARSFAYPNGDWTPEAATTLAALGYDVAAVFDHRLTRNPPRRAFEVSRLRVAADASVSRFRSIVSGANPALFGLRRSRLKATGMR